MPDDVRTKSTQALALDVRRLPPSTNKVALASWLTSLSTEGDFGHDTLQEVATTLSKALEEKSPPDSHGKVAYEYTALAQLVRYEHVQATLKDPQFNKAMMQLEADDRKREQADFTLNDLEGKSWALSGLRGKVVLVNFWATWCPPCRKEMPDLNDLYQRFRDQGLVILGISDEDPEKVSAFAARHPLFYPILLDPGRNVNKQLGIEAIPRSFLYDRQGKLVAEAIDMRTRQQFLRMLAQAGFK